MPYSFTLNYIDLLLRIVIVKPKIHLELLDGKAFISVPLNFTYKLTKCQINTLHQRGENSPTNLQQTRVSQQPRITQNEPFYRIILYEDCIHSAQKPALKYHLNKNTFLNELTTIDLEYKMEMEQTLIMMNLSAC